MIEQRNAEGTRERSYSAQHRKVRECCRLIRNRSTPQLRPKQNNYSLLPTCYDRSQYEPNVAQASFNYETTALSDEKQTIATKRRAQPRHSNGRREAQQGCDLSEAVTVGEREQRQRVARIDAQSIAVHEPHQRPHALWRRQTQRNEIGRICCCCCCCWIRKPIHVRNNERSAQNKNTVFVSTVRVVHNDFALCWRHRK